MFQNVSITGPTASIFRGYRQVATLSAWSLSANGASASFSGALENGDRFQLTQHGLEVRVARQKGQQPFRWPVESLHIEGRTVSAQVRLSEEGSSHGA